MKLGSHKQELCLVFILAMILLTPAVEESLEEASDPYDITPSKSPLGDFTGRITVSSCVYAQFWTARIPLFASNFIKKSGIIQYESWFAITPTPLYILITLETLCTCTPEDTVQTLVRCYCFIEIFILHRRYARHENSTVESTILSTLNHSKLYICIPLLLQLGYV